MQPFAPSATAMFSSWRRGAEASTPPTQDTFRDVFANHLLDRLNARKEASGGTDRSLSRPGTAQGAHRSVSQTGTWRKADTRYQAGNRNTLARSPAKEEDKVQAASSSEEPRQAAAAREKRQQEVHKSHRKPESQTAAAGLAPDQNQATSDAPQKQDGAATATPLRLCRTSSRSYSLFRAAP
jgi:hypothetical protein